MQPVTFDFKQNFFQLFALPEHFRLDGTRLEQQYHDLQIQVHPDKFAHLPEAERRLSMQWATRVNEAYQTLRSPVRRARYLLSLYGVDTQEENNTAMPMDFLMQQMEWREAIEDARRASALEVLEQLEARVNQETQALHALLAATIDDEKNYHAAAEGVRKLKFLEKLEEEIASSFDEIDN